MSIGKREVRHFDLGKRRGQINPAPVTIVMPWTYEDGSITEFSLQLKPNGYRKFDWDIWITKVKDTFSNPDYFIREFTFTANSFEYVEYPVTTKFASITALNPTEPFHLMIENFKRKELYCELKVIISEKPASSVLRSCTSLSHELSLKRKSMDSLSDVEIHCGNKIFKSHKLVLATRSPVFEAMFQHKGTQEDESGKVIVKDIDPDIMSRFLDFMYEDQASEINPDVVEELLVAGDKYGFQVLVDVCKKEILKTLSTQNCVRKLQFAMSYNIVALEEKAKALVLKNISTLIKTKDFANLVGQFPNVFEEK